MLKCQLIQGWQFHLDYSRELVMDLDMPLVHHSSVCSRSFFTPCFFLYSFCQLFQPIFSLKKCLSCLWYDGSTNSQPYMEIGSAAWWNNRVLTKLKEGHTPANCRRSYKECSCTHTSIFVNWFIVVCLIFVPPFDLGNLSESSDPFFKVTTHCCS